MTIEQCIRDIAWPDVERALWDRGYAKLGPLLTPAECDEMAALYTREDLFRSRIDMQRYRFGVGEYKYFGYPLPPLVAALREAVYPHLAVVANAWAEALADAERFPLTLAEFTQHCQEAGQSKPTPLLLRYEAGGYNCLHQDVYGDITFPLQLLCFLDEPGRDYEGGEFLVVEQRPRAQSIGQALRCAKGEAVVFTTRHRPVRGSRGFYRANMKHGVSRIESGTRHTLGVIFHEAK